MSGLSSASTFALLRKCILHLNLNWLCSQIFFNWFLILSVPLEPFFLFLIIFTVYDFQWILCVEFDVCKGEVWMCMARLPVRKVRKVNLMTPLEWLTCSFSIHYPVNRWWEFSKLKLSSWWYDTNSPNYFTWKSVADRGEN